MSPCIESVLQTIGDVPLLLLWSANSKGEIVLSEGGLLTRWGISAGETLGTSIKYWADEQHRLRREAGLQPKLWAPYDIAFPRILAGEAKVVLRHDFTWDGVTVELISICTRRHNASGQRDGMTVFAFDAKAVIPWL